MQNRTAFVSLSLRLGHYRMYANHNLYNELLIFLEIHHMGWSLEDSVTLGKQFVEGMSKAFFQCNPFVWKTLDDMHNIGAFALPLHFAIYVSNHRVRMSRRRMCRT